MEEKFAKQGKSLPELYDLVHYITRPVIDIKEVIEMYDVWAEQYDKDIVTSEYTGHDMLADEIAVFYGNERDLKVLDVGAGTGGLGKAMYSKGFKKLDAIDASAQMLEKAKSLGIYENLYLDIVGPKKLSIRDNTYDLLMSTGCFIPGHLKEDCYEELIRITKRGGHIYILTNENHLRNNPEYSDNIETRMLEMQEQGVWKRLAKKTMENYAKKHQGVLFVLQKC